MEREPVSSSTILPAGVHITREPARALLHVPAALALHDETLLAELLDALLAEPELRSLDVQIYEPVYDKAAELREDYGAVIRPGPGTLDLRATISFSALKRVS